jgi:S1-C subfamily serine protease
MIVSIIAKGFGIGFFVTENLIATNIHCVAGATSVKVKLLDSNIEYGVG